MKMHGSGLPVASARLTEWLDHRKTRQSAHQGLASIWFGEVNRIKAKALTVAVEMLPHFRN